MNISLTVELQAFIDAKVESGLYQSASEVVREGLRLLVESNDRALDAEINRKIEEAYADLEAGKYYTPEKSRARLLKHVTAKKKKNKP
jgi:antitoxin ParD1/3/4